jgi:flagellin
MATVSLSCGRSQQRSSSLQSSVKATSQSRSQYRLATGKKVNSAVDNPVNFFTAASASMSRASQLTGLLDGISNGIQTIQAPPRKGVDSITKLVGSLQSTVKQAQADNAARPPDQGRHGAGDRG